MTLAVMVKHEMMENQKNKIFMAMCSSYRIKHQMILCLVHAKLHAARLNHLLITFILVYGVKADDEFIDITLKSRYHTFLL